MISAKVIACVEEIDCAPVSYFLSINTKENIERRLVEPVKFLFLPKMGLTKKLIMNYELLLSKKGADWITPVGLFAWAKMK